MSDVFCYVFNQLVALVSSTSVNGHLSPYLLCMALPIHDRSMVEITPVHQKVNEAFVITGRKRTRKMTLSDFVGKDLKCTLLFGKKYIQVQLMSFSYIV